MLPLLMGATKGLLGNTAKNAVKNKALGTAKDFVTGKKKGKKGGALVKRQSAGGSGKKTKAKVKPTQSYAGNGASSSSSSITKAKVSGGGAVSYEKLTQQLNNMVGVSDALNKAIASQYAFKEKQAKKKKKVRVKAKKEEREQQLEDKKPARTIGILAGVGAAGKKFGIFDFLINTLMGGLAGLLINNFDTIKSFFGGLGGAFNNKMNLLKWGITALRGPIQAATVTLAKVFKPALVKLGSGLKNGLLGVGEFVGNGLKKIGTGVFNFAKNLISKITGAGAGTAKTLASSGTRGASSAATSATRQLGTGVASDAAEKTFTKQGAKRLGLFSKAFKRIPLVGSIIGIGIDLAMGESLDRAIVGAIGAALGSTIGAFIGQGLIPIPGLGALVGGVVGAGIGDYLAKELYSNIAQNLVGQGLSPLGGDASMPSWRKSLEDGIEPWTAPDENPSAGTPTGTPTRTRNQTSTTSGTTSRQQSFNKIYDIARRVGGAKFPEIVAAQAMHETGYLANPNSVYFKTGKTNAFGQTISPSEVGSNGIVDKYWFRNRWWAVYDSLESSVKHNIKLWHDGSRNAGNYNNFNTPLEGIASVAPAYSPNADPANIALGYTVDAYSKGMVDALKIGGFDPKGRAGQSSTIQATTQPSASVSSIQLASTSSGGLTNVVPTLNLQSIGAGSGPVGMTSGRGQRGVKHHAGVDIGTNKQKGWYVAFKLSGKVTDVGTYSGYGKTVIITSGGKDFLFAHLASTMVKKGDAYNGEIIGEIGRTGRSTGEHLHFEVSPAGTGGYGQDEDPMPYVKYLEIGRLDPSGTPTRTTRLQPSTSTAARAQRVQQRASYEGGGSQVVTVPVPAGGQQQMMAGGQAGTVMLGGSTKAMVNSYYKSQLMGFLYKQG